MIKKNIIVIFIGIVIILSSLILLSNKNFLKEHYYNSDGLQIYIPRYSYLIKEGTNKIEYPVQCCSSAIELNTLRSGAYLDKFLNGYIETLPSCYNESYFYDSNSNVTYSRHTVKSSGFSNKVTITFQEGNYCENELIIENNWLDIVNDSHITNYTFNYMKLLKLLKKSERIDFSGRINFDEQGKHEISYLYNKFGYTLYFNAYAPTIIGVTRIDANDAAKYAIYDIGEDAKIYLNNLLD